MFSIWLFSFSFFDRPFSVLKLHLILSQVQLLIMTQEMVFFYWKMVWKILPELVTSPDPSHGFKYPYSKLLSIWVLLVSNGWTASALYRKMNGLGPTQMRNISPNFLLHSMSFWKNSAKKDSCNFYVSYCRSMLFKRKMEKLQIA